MAVDVLLGLQWGDEGKGKIVDFLAPSYDIIARFQGGPNAGHTLKINGQKFVLHTVPSGIFRDGAINVIGNGVVLDPITLEKELAMLTQHGVDFSSRLVIANKAHLILPTHRWLDAASEQAKGKAKIGSTLKGIGPTYMDKTGRNGLRFGDVFTADFHEKYEALKQKHLQLLERYEPVEFDLEKEEELWLASLNHLRNQVRAIDCEYFINQALAEGKKILAEGAQGSMLDIDYGTYPFVTSSSTTTAGVCTGLGIAPQKIGKVIGITKAYCTRVGSGPFPTELFDETGEKLKQEGNEFGATTGRPRRCGWIDILQLRYTIMLNGVTSIVLTKLDVLNVFESIGIGIKYRIKGEELKALPYDLCVGEIDAEYEFREGWMQEVSEAKDASGLPEKAQSFVAKLEELLGVSIDMISTGPGREELLVKP